MSRRPAPAACGRWDNRPYCREVHVITRGLVQRTGGISSSQLGRASTSAQRRRRSADGHRRFFMRMTGASAPTGSAPIAAAAIDVAAIGCRCHPPNLNPKTNPKTNSGVNNYEDPHGRSARHYVPLPAAGRRPAGTDRQPGRPHAGRRRSWRRQDPDAGAPGSQHPIAGTGPAGGAAAVHLQRGRGR